MMQADVSQIVGVSVRTLQRWAKIPEYCQFLGGEPIEIVQPIQIKTEPLPYNPHELAGREEMRQAEWHLLNSTQSAIMSKIERGDLRAIAVLLKISERRCKLLRLDIQPLPAIRVAEYLENEKTTLEHPTYCVNGRVVEEGDRQPLLRISL